METKSKSITACDVKGRIIGKAPTDFFDFSEKQKKIKPEELSIGTHRHYTAIISKIKLFCKKDKLFFDEITVEFVRRFQEYLIPELHNHANTIHSKARAFHVPRQI